MRYVFYCPTEEDEVLGEMLMRTVRDKHGKYLTNARLEDSAVSIGKNLYEVIRLTHINNKVENVIVAPLRIDILNRDYFGKLIEL